MKFHEFISLMSMAALAKSIIIRRSLHGVLLSTETSGETTFSSYDAFARVAQTWRAAVSATTGTGVSPVDSTFAYNNRSEVVSAAIGTNLFTHAYDDIGNHLLFGKSPTIATGESARQSSGFIPPSRRRRRRRWGYTNGKRWRRIRLSGTATTSSLKRSSSSRSNEKVRATTALGMTEP